MIRYINPKTKEEFKEFLNELNNLGYVHGYTNGKIENWTIWGDYKEKTAIEIDVVNKRARSYSSISYFKEKYNADIEPYVKGMFKETAVLTDSEITTDKLNVPEHYQINGKDTMEIILEIVRKNTSDIEEAIYLFNTIKYLIRYKDKDGKKDLLKAKDYLNRLIEVV